MISRETEAQIAAVEKKLKTWKPKPSKLPAVGTMLGQRILKRLKRFTEKL